MKEVINTKQIKSIEEPMFFGNGLGIQRYDEFKYPYFYKSFQTQIANFWRPEEVNLQKDKIDFATLSTGQKEIFTKNLKYQILLDSVQARAISLLTQQVTLPELEAACIAWQFFELIHSFSYTHLIKNVYPNPSEVFDTTLTDQEVLRRATSVTQYYNKMIADIKDPKENLYLTLMSVNILEGIRFYVSFACAYAFAENKLMEGNAKIIYLINRDENMHLALTQYALNKMRTEPDEEMQDVVKRCEPQVREMFKKAAEEEMEWARYLFANGSLLGLNDSLLIQYMQWLTNRRMVALSLEPIFPAGTENPLGWLNNWTDSSKIQVAPQETEIETYKVGSIKQDVDDFKFDFDL